MPDKTNDTVVATVMEQLMAESPQAMAQIIAALMNPAMRMEREPFLGAGHYERAVDRRGYADDTKPELIDTLAGTLGLEVPKTSGTEDPFYPHALARGLQCGPTFVPRRHAGGRRDVGVRRRDTAMPSGSWPNSAAEPVFDASQPGHQAAR